MREPDAIVDHLVTNQVVTERTEIVAKDGRVYRAANIKQSNDRETLQVVRAVPKVKGKAARKAEKRERQHARERRRQFLEHIRPACDRINAAFDRENNNGIVMPEQSAVAPDLDLEVGTFTYQDPDDELEEPNEFGGHQWPRRRAHPRSRGSVNQRT